MASNNPKEDLESLAKQILPEVDELELLGNMLHGQSLDHIDQRTLGRMINKCACAIREQIETVPGEGAS